MAELELLRGENNSLRKELEHLKTSKLNLVMNVALEMERLRQFIKVLSSALEGAGFSQQDIDKIGQQSVSKQQNLNTHRNEPIQSQRNPQSEVIAHETEPLLQRPINTQQDFVPNVPPHSVPSQTDNTSSRKAETQKKAAPQSIWDINENESDSEEDWKKKAVLSEYEPSRSQIKENEEALDEEQADMSKRRNIQSIFEESSSEDGWDDSERLQVDIGTAKNDAVSGTVYFQTL
mmetsp:Transcript_58244/g.92549  ORF Transcript_58244/g.92549 Transcript_58244/m.92549 type:complete len:234 (+) Transcript_58244:70-771(+)